MSVDLLKVRLGRRLAAAIVATLCVATAPVYAAGKHAAFVMDANSGAIITAQDADAPRYPASLTKMMTLYLMFEQMEQGRMRPSTRIRMTAEGASVPPSKLGLEPGAELSAEDAIKALIVKSANDVAVAVAQHIAGSEEKFARLMTAKARQLGMASTTFRNPHGLPDSGQITTARDMVTLGTRLFDDFPKYFGLFATREFRFNGDSHRTHNTLLLNYEGADGIKTGYISASGYNVVTSVRRGNKHVIGAVFGGSSGSSRNQTMRTLLNLALFKASGVKSRRVAQPAVAAAQPAVPRPSLRDPIRPALRPTVATDAERIATPRSSALMPAAGDRQPVVATGPVTGATSDIEVARVRNVVIVPRTRTEPKPALPAASPAPEPIAQRTASAAIPQAQAPGRGTPPSTLQAQAESLSRGATTPTPAPPAGGLPAPAGRQQRTAALPPVASPPVNRPAGPAPAMAAGSFHVQIGAFATPAEAERQFASIRAATGDLVGGRRTAAIPASVNGRALVRARYVGLDSASATSLCNELRRRSIDCMVTKAE